MASLKDLPTPSAARRRATAPSRAGYRPERPEDHASRDCGPARLWLPGEHAEARQARPRVHAGQPGRGGRVLRRAGRARAAGDLFFPRSMVTLLPT